MTLRKGSYYYVSRICSGKVGSTQLIKDLPSSKCVAKHYSTAIFPRDLCIVFTDLNDHDFSIGVADRRELKERVIPVSKTFNKYLKLTEQK